MDANEKTPSGLPLPPKREEPVVGVDRGTWSGGTPIPHNLPRDDMPPEMRDKLLEQMQSTLAGVIGAPTSLRAHLRRMTIGNVARRNVRGTINPHTGKPHRGAKRPAGSKLARKIAKAQGRDA